jgi:hypothetical protein
LPINKHDDQGEPHIFIEPSRTYSRKPSHKGGYVPSEFHANEKELPIESQFDKTLSAIEAKKPADNSAYYILDLKVSTKHPVTLAVVKRFNARILSELSESEVLVTSSVDQLRSAKEALKVKSFRNNLFNIHELVISDIVDPDLNFKDSSEKNLTIYLMPNLGLEKAKEYVEQVKRHLAQLNVPIKGLFINQDTGDAYIDARVREEQLNNLVNSFGFIFKAHETIHAQSFEPTNQVTVNSDPQRKLSSEQNYVALPKICLLDTGVSLVPPIINLIADRYVEPPFTDLNDLDNHGTSVASLAIYGDTISNPILPRARVISHKIMHNKQSVNIVTALANAIQMHIDCKTFSCSVNYTATKLALKLATRTIDRLAQTTNSLVVFSAGNIDVDDVKNSISQGSSYPDYINEAAVFHPSDAPSVFSVGAYSKYSNQNSIAPPDAPAPFTRFGTNLKELKNCPKPELVEHGGNACIVNGAYDCTNIGIPVISNNGSIVEGIGTSFSAPLVSSHLARLWDKYRSQVKNSETLKAILLSTCKLTQNHPRYVGLGAPNENELFSSRFGVVRIIFEGNLPLVGSAGGASVIPTDEIKVFVPADVTSIELFLVHTDNYNLSPFPKLNSYLSVEVEKPGKGGSVNPSFGLPSAQTHVKHLIYRYKRNIKGDWFFRIIPHAIGISTSQRANVSIRYGGVIKLITKKPRFGLSQSVISGLRRGGNIKISSKPLGSEND